MTFPASLRLLRGYLLALLMLPLAFAAGGVKAQTYSGIWDVTESQDGSACGFGTNTYEYPVQLRDHGQLAALYALQETKPFTVSLFNSGRLRSGESFDIEDGWHVTTTLDMQFSGNSMTGSYKWLYTKGNLSCVDNSTYTATRRGSASSALAAPVLSVQQSGNTVSAQWSQVAGATSYTLFYAPWPGGSPLTAVNMGTSRSISQALPAGSSFYVTVAANAATATSALSKVEVFTTGKPANSNPTTATVASLTISPSVLYVKPGQTGDLTVVARSSSGTTLTGRTIQWSSSNNGIATVTQTSSGARIAAVANGRAVITATSEGISATMTVNVASTLATGVTISPASLTLNLGQQQQLTAAVKDAAGNALNDDVSWTSTNNGIASVTSGGLVTAVGAGTTQITARSSEGVSASLTVTVAGTTETYPSLRDLYLTPYSTFMGWTPNGTMGIGAVGTMTNGARLTKQYANGLIWTSSNPAVATVTKGEGEEATLRFLSKGTTTIKVTLGSKSASMIVGVGVNPVPVQSVSFNTTDLIVGKCFTAAAAITDIQGTVSPAHTPTYAVTWSSSNRNVVSVEKESNDYYAQVCGVSAGTATVTVTSGGKSYSASLKVGAAGSFDGGVILPDNVDVLVGQDVNFSASFVTDNDAWYAKSNLSWVSSNTSIATVNGPVKALRTGYTASVHGVALGTATLSVTADSVTRTMRVSVVDQLPARRIQLSTVLNNFQIGMSEQPKVYLYDWAGKALDTKGRTMTWKSDNTSVVTVDASGTVRAVGVGSALVTVTVDGVSDSEVYTVAATIGSVKVTPANATIAVNAETVLTASVYNPQGGVITGRTISWSSSNRSIATVSNGRVVGVGSGTVTITASTGGVSGFATVVIGSGSNSGGGGSGGGGSGGGGGGGSGSPSPVVGNCSLAVPLDGLARNEESGWYTVNNLGSTLEFMVKVGSMNAGSAANPSYQYNLYIRNKGSKKIPVSWSYRLGGSAPTSAGYTDTLDPGEQAYDYFFGAPNVEPLWIYISSTCK